MIGEKTEVFSVGVKLKCSLWKKLRVWSHRSAAPPRMRSESNLFLKTCFPINLKFCALTVRALGTKSYQRLCSGATNSTLCKHTGNGNICGCVSHTPHLLWIKIYSHDVILMRYIVNSYKHVGVHIDNKLDWSTNRYSVQKLPVSAKETQFLQHLMLQMFYHSVTSSIIFVINKLTRKVGESWELR